jgi:hypothetical protein
MLSSSASLSSLFRSSRELRLILLLRTCLPFFCILQSQIKFQLTGDMGCCEPSSVLGRGVLNFIYSGDAIHFDALLEADDGRQLVACSGQRNPKFLCNLRPSRNIYLAKSQSLVFILGCKVSQNWSELGATRGPSCMGPNHVDCVRGVVGNTLVERDVI